MALISSLPAALVKVESEINLLPLTNSTAITFEPRSLAIVCDRQERSATTLYYGPQSSGVEPIRPSNVSVVTERTTPAGLYHHHGLLNRSSIATVVIWAFAAWYLVSCFVTQARRFFRAHKFHAFSASQHCGYPNALPKPSFGRWMHKLELLTYCGDLLDGYFAEQYHKFGATHALYDHFGVPRVIHTVDPINLYDALVTHSKDWGPAKGRTNALYPLVQEGLLLTDGETWHRNRKLIVRHVNTGRSKQVCDSETDIRLLFNSIGEVDNKGWTRVVDLADLFHRLALDISTAYLLGTRSDSQADGIWEGRMRAAMDEFGLVQAERVSRMTFQEAYSILRTYLSWRAKLGSKCWLADGPTYRNACAVLVDKFDDLIRKAIESSSNASQQGVGKPNGNTSLIDSLVREVKNPVQIRNLIMDLFIAGQNMVGTMSSWIFAQLGQHPETYQQVRCEVIDKFGTEKDLKLAMTWENMHACSTMNAVILESLHFYPLLAT